MKRCYTMIELLLVAATIVILVSIAVHQVNTSPIAPDGTRRTASILYIVHGSAAGYSWGKGPLLKDRDGFWAKVWPSWSSRITFVPWVKDPPPPPVPTPASLAAIYDPTNGTTSYCHVYRTNKSELSIPF